MSPHSCAPISVTAMTDADDESDPRRRCRFPRHRKRSIRKIVVRIVFVVGALGLSFWILARTFDDLDLAEIRSAVASLNDAEALSLGSMWLLWIGAQGLLTASLVPGLAVRHGVVAFLGPAAVTSVVPGPSDLPIRFQMLTSWGRTTGEATLAVAAGGIFSIGVKLALADHRRDRIC